MGLLLAGYSALSAQSDSLRSEPFVLGETLAFWSDKLQEERKLNLYLPPSYTEDTARSYPVIWLLDGSADEDFIHMAGLVQFGTFSWVNLLPECILVGVANVDRVRDFTHPSEIPLDQEEFPSSGGSAAFLEFLYEELKPLLASRYRTNGQHCLIGQSMGGLLAAQVLVHHPEWYSHYLILSPSLWWDEGSLLRARQQPIPPETRIFIGVGKEGEEMEGPARALYESVRSSHPDLPGLFFQFFPEHDHGDLLHQAAYCGFQLLYPPPKEESEQ